MDCDRMREVLIEHVDGLLGREEAEDARVHLAACGPCRALQEEVRRNFAALDCWEDEDLPAGSFERLVERLPGGPSSVPAAPVPAKRSWPRLLVPYAAGVATAAAAMLIYVLPRGGNGGHEPRSPAPATGPAAPPAETGPAIAPVDPPVFAGGPARPAGGAAAPGAFATVAAEAPAHRPALKRGEQVLEFRVADEGVLRKFLLPGGVDPEQILLIEEVRPMPSPSGVR